MNLRDELSEEEPFVLEAGTPTITIHRETDQLMIPWMSFRHAVWQDGLISLYFQGWLILIEGKELTDLWLALQVQDVRFLESSQHGGRSDCLILKLEVRPA